MRKVVDYKVLIVDFDDNNILMDYLSKGWSLHGQAFIIDPLGEYSARILQAIIKHEDVDDGIDYKDRCEKLQNFIKKRMYNDYFNEITRHSLIPITNEDVERITTNTNRLSEKCFSDIFKE